MQRTQIAAYRKALTLMYDVREILGNVKTAGWTQAVVLNEAYEQLEQSIDALQELQPCGARNPLASRRREAAEDGLPGY